MSRIENPTEEMQILAVRQNALQIKFIQNPTEKAQLEAIIRNIDAILLYKKSH